MISSPIGRLGDHYEVVVVGSGYGGSIMASRFARAGRQVCLLERGPERWPGDFPDGILSGVKNVQARTARGHFGSPTALFDFRLEPDMSVLVGCGLGGTSLINANVALRPNRDVFDDARWPAALRGNRDLLEPYFELAERWLGSNPYPADRPTPPKLAALEVGALAIGENATRPPINVTFADGISAGGVPQKACNDCGDCVAGCNVGAKNTVLMNYLPDAHSHGAQIFCEVEVASVIPAPDDAAGRWMISFNVVDENRKKFDAPNQFMTANHVILAAGTLGSSEILLRSRRNGLAVSDKVGLRFSGNGDVLGFGTDASREINGIGWGKHTGREPVGPTITGVVDMSNQRPPGAGLIIEEGAIPSVLASIMPAALAIAETTTETRGTLRRIIDLLSSWRSNAARTMTYLVMSADDDDGELRLEGDHLAITWKGAGTEGPIVDDNDLLEQVTGAIGGRYLPDPLWDKALGKTLVTVHPLGGCVMADDAADGVVDDFGRVFSGPDGTQVHEGLVVSDGSIIPRPLDLNPLLTISALAERSAAEIASVNGWSFDTSPATEAIDHVRGDEPSAVGLRFTERMAGWFRLGAADYADGESTGRSAGSSMEFVLTLDIADLDATVNDPTAVRSASGTVTAAELSPEALTVTDGKFQLMVPVPDQVDTWHMRYSMMLTAVDGRQYRFDGHKVMKEGPIWRAWHATTTLFVDVSDPANGSVIGRGILHIGTSDLLRQIASARATNAQGLIAKLAARLKFGRAFLGDVLHAYGTVPDEPD